MSFEDVLEAPESAEKAKKCSPVVFDVACRAMEHLHEARALQKQLPSNATSAFLSTISTSMFLKELEKANFNVFDEKLQQRSTMRFHVEVLKHFFLGKY